jgi:hypothetical protein
LGLLAAYPVEYAAAVAAAEGDLAALLVEEKKRFAADHCEIGRWLLEDWHLPAEFCSIVGRHHEKPGRGAFDLLTVAQLACQLADMLGYSLVASAHQMTFDEVRSLLPEWARIRFTTKPEVLVELIEQVTIENGLVLPEPGWSSPSPAECQVKHEFTCFTVPRGHSMALSFLLAGILLTLGLAASAYFW